MIFDMIYGEGKIFRIGSHSPAMTAENWLHAKIDFPPHTEAQHPELVRIIRRLIIADPISRMSLTEVISDLESANDGPST
jgi:hypothetical protein